MAGMGKLFDGVAYKSVRNAGCLDRAAVARWQLAMAASHEFGTGPPQHLRSAGASRMLATRAAACLPLLPTADTVVVTTAITAATERKGAEEP